MSRSAVLLRLLPLLAAVVLSMASAPPPTYSSRRAAFVPQNAPQMRSGAPMETRAELTLAAPGAASLGAPEAGDSSTPGLELPRWSLSGAGRLRLRPGLDVGLVYERGSAEETYELADDQPDVHGGDTYGYGLSFMGSFYSSVEGLRFSVGMDLLTYSLPFVEYRTCVENCEGVPTNEVISGRTRVPVISFAFLPSWKSGRWTYFAGLTARNQPTVDRGGTEIGANDGDVSMGEFNVMVSAGAELAIGHGVRALAMVYQPFESDPVDYAPTFAVGLTYAFGKPKPAAASYGAPPPAAAVAPPAEAERKRDAR